MKLIQDKKGQMPMKGLPSFILGVILIIGGGLSLFGEMLFGLTLPPIPIMLLEILITIGGLLLIIDGFKGVGQGATQVMPKKLNLIIGFLAFIGGTLLLLVRFGVIAQFTTIPTVVLHSVMLLAGFILFLDGILGAKNISM